MSTTIVRNPIQGFLSNEVEVTFHQTFTFPLVINVPFWSDVDEMTSRMKFILTDQVDIETYAYTRSELVELVETYANLLNRFDVVSVNNWLRNNESYSKYGILVLPDQDMLTITEAVCLWVTRQEGYQPT